MWHATGPLIVNAIIATDEQKCFLAMASEVRVPKAAQAVAPLDYRPGTAQRVGAC